MATKTMTAAEAISQRVAASAPQKAEEEPAAKPISSLASVELEPEVPVESVKLDGLVRRLSHTSEKHSLMVDSTTHRRS